MKLSDLKKIDLLHVCINAQNIAIMTEAQLTLLNHQEVQRADILSVSNKVVDERCASIIDEKFSQFMSMDDLRKIAWCDSKLVSSKFQSRLLSCSLATISDFWKLANNAHSETVAIAAVNVLKDKAQDTVLEFKNEVPLECLRDISKYARSEEVKKIAQYAMLAYLQPTNQDLRFLAGFGCDQEIKERALRKLHCRKDLSFDDMQYLSQCGLGEHYVEILNTDYYRDILQFV